MQTLMKVSAIVRSTNRRIASAMKTEKSMKDLRFHVAAATMGQYNKSRRRLSEECNNQPVATDNHVVKERKGDRYQPPGACQHVMHCKTCHANFCLRCWKFYHTTHSLGPYIDEILSIK